MRIKFHEALVPLVPVFSNPVMFLLLFAQSVNMHVCSSRAKKTKKDKWSLKHAVEWEWVRMGRDMFYRAVQS